MLANSLYGVKKGKWPALVLSDFRATYIRNIVFLKENIQRLPPSPRNMQHIMHSYGKGGSN
jgi:hypothetical protein